MSNEQSSGSTPAGRPVAPQNVSVVVLSYGMSGESQAAVSELTRDGLIESSQILEVHNPSQPGERVPEQDHRVLNLDRNLGYAGGMNAGLSDPLTRSRDYVLLLTHDVRMTGQAAIALAAALAADRQLAVVGPKLVGDGVTWSVGVRRKSLWQFTHVTAVNGSTGFQASDSLDGSALMIRQADLDANRFDERFFMYFEETDLVMRLTATGRIAAVVTDVSAESEPGHSKRPRASSYLMARNGLEVAHRYGGRQGCAAYALALGWLSVRELGGPILHRDFSRLGTAVPQARARIWGAYDCARRRFGPPPQALADGDLNLH